MSLSGVVCMSRGMEGGEEEWCVGRVVNWTRGDMWVLEERMRWLCSSQHLLRLHFITNQSKWKHLCLVLATLSVEKEWWGLLLWSCSGNDLMLVVAHCIQPLYAVAREEMWSGWYWVRCFNQFYRYFCYFGLKFSFFIILTNSSKSMDPLLSVSTERTIKRHSSISTFSPRDVRTA